MVQVAPEKEDHGSPLRDAADVDSGAYSPAQPNVASSQWSSPQKPPPETKVGWVSVPRRDGVDPDAKAEDDEDGTSAAELFARLDRVKVRPDYLIERIELESNVLFTIVKSANFLVYLIHFLLAMYEFCPAANLSMVHRQIGEHFQLSTLDNVQSFNQVYDFIAMFEHQNEELMATSYHFWCEKRYDTTKWNNHLGVPEHICQSPRQGALGAPHYDDQTCHHCHGTSWTAWNESQYTVVSDSHGSGSNHGIGTSVMKKISAGHGSASASHGSASADHGSTSADHGSTSAGHGSTPAPTPAPAPPPFNSSAPPDSMFARLAAPAPAVNQSSTNGSSAANQSSADNQSSAGNQSSAASTGQGSAPGKRKLRAQVTPEIRKEVQRRKLAGGAANSTEWVCHDYDDLLVAMEHIPGLTCAKSADWVCDLEAGLLACELTCGYCPPFEYVRTRKFEKPMVTILPVVVFQTRMPWVACESEAYSNTYNKQSTNPFLVILPTLDGERNDEIVRCVDREANVDSDWAHENVDCPDQHCIDGKFKDTKKADFHGMSIYPKMLIEPHKDVMGMRNLEWLDFQTSMVALSTMIYTEDLEIFTSVTIEFHVDKTGKLSSTKKVQSYKEFIGHEKDEFVRNIFLVIIMSGVGIFHSVYLIIASKDNRNFTNIFELFSRVALCGFTVYFLMSWMKLKPMHDEFDELLHAFLDVNAYPENLMEELSKTTDRFFEVKTHIYHENRWVDAMRMTAFMMLYVQFVQVILYLNAHPRMALLTRTLIFAWDNILHFFSLFLPIFLVLAYMIHWLLGGDLFERYSGTGFGSFSEAIMSQTRMIFGAWIYSPGVDELHGVWLTMYWVWAATFMLLVFFILLNFFLAIIVDAFVVVKEMIEKQVTECSFPYDCYDAFASTRKFYSKGWPSRDAIIRACGNHVPKWEGGRLKTAMEIDDEEDHDKPEMRALELSNLFGSKEAVAAFLADYVYKVPDILLPNAPAAEDEAEEQLSPQAKREQMEQARNLKKMFKTGTEAAMLKFVRSITQELGENHVIDWDTASGRLSCVLHRELARSGSIDA